MAQVDFMRLDDDLEESDRNLRGSHPFKASVPRLVYPNDWTNKQLYWTKKLPLNYSGVKPLYTGDNVARVTRRE